MATTRRRARPGSAGRGRFYHVIVRPRSQFVRFRVQDVGARGGVERVAGQRASGTWDTVKWLIAKRHARVRGGALVGTSVEARKLLRALGSTPVQISGDRFRAKPRANIPEREKPTPAQRRAWRRNIRKAQAARRRR